MNNREFSRIGRGVYTFVEAERLTMVPRRRIRRWTKGYSYKYKGEIKHTPAAIEKGYALDDDIPMLDFTDLIEIMFLNAFRNYGVSWKTINIASDKAKTMLKRRRPFSTRLFKTDGRTILGEIAQESDDKVLIDLIKDQYAFEKVLAPYLNGLEFNKFDEPERWWPLGINRSVVIDPHRSFGAPIVVQGGIPTLILYKAVSADQSVDFVANWYDVERHEVVDAYEFERKLAA